MKESGGRGQMCVFALGGNANNGANAGAFYVNANNAFSIANSNYGVRHTYYCQSRQVSRALAEAPENVSAKSPFGASGASSGTKAPGNKKARI